MHVFLFSTDRKIFHIKHISMQSTKENKKSLKVYIRLILNTVLLPEWSTAVFFCLVIVVHESLVPWTVKLPAVLQKNLTGPTHSVVFQHFLCIWTLSNNDFPAMTDSSFHTEDNWGTHMHLLQKVQMLTDVPEGNTMQQEPRGWKLFEFKYQGKCNLFCLLGNM